MSRRLSDIRTSLAVGFAEGGELPAALAQYRGRQHRAIAPSGAFPFEDAQFEVVLLSENSVTEKIVREAHRVLRPQGWLFFTVPEKTAKAAGFSLPEIYSIVRSGFNIIEVERPAWWHFGKGARTLTISAQKKSWKVLTNTYRPYV